MWSGQLRIQERQDKNVTVKERQISHATVRYFFGKHGSRVFRTEADIAEDGDAVWAALMVGPETARV